MFMNDVFLVDLNVNALSMEKIACFILDNQPLAYNAKITFPFCMMLVS